jgi:hypothetical protein
VTLAKGAGVGHPSSPISTLRRPTAENNRMKQMRMIFCVFGKIGPSLFRQRIQTLKQRPPKRQLR